MPAAPEQELVPLDFDQPIISDEEFERSLPSLDAPQTPEAPVGVATPAAPRPGLAGEPGVETPAEVLADAPAVDPALDEPLPAIAGFDVTTPEATPDDDDAPATVRYVLNVEGLREVGLQGRFRDLAALEGSGRATRALIASRTRDDQGLAISLLRSQGYFDATATSAIEPLPEEAGRLRVTIAAVPGPRYDFSEIRVTGAETIPPALVRDALVIRSGEPIVAYAVIAAEANVAVRLPQQGYPFTEVGERRIDLNPDTTTGDYTLPVSPGPRARFRGYRTEGDLAFSAKHVGVLARFDRGELYDSRLVDDLREAMIATSLFSSVAAAPVRTAELSPEGDEYVDILVTQDAGPPRSLTAALGFSSGEGFRAEGAWEHRNLFPPQGALRAAAVLGTRQQSLEGRFIRSNFHRRDRTLALIAEAGRFDYDAFLAFTGRLSARLSRESTPIWQKRITWAFGAELVGTNESFYDFAAGERNRGTFFIGAIPAQVGFDTSNNLLDPTRGFRLLARTSPEVSLRGGATPYVRNQLEGSTYYPVRSNLVIAGRARFGSIAGTTRDSIAPSRRFYGGGGGSVRGYGFQELGPRDPNGDPVGGRSLTEFSLEARYRFGDFGIVPFIDAGQVYDKELPGFSDLQYGVGVGGRIYTNFGPLRADVAMPLNRRAGQGRVALYISIGQAF